ncbi:MAG: hypothetical protein Ct9H300mP21_04390 [Pseudomonadota bacterium]|nr:MAG: hypothetical protein Ct9H300mP21_04390 [Pseudomonadota bacterium]
MFSFFKNSVGVANVLDYAERVEQQPFWMTKKRTPLDLLSLLKLQLRTPILKN